MDSELPCRTFTGTVPVDQRARLVDTPREPVTQHVTLFRREKKLAQARVAEHQESLSHSAGYERVEPGVFLHFLFAVLGPPPVHSERTGVVSAFTLNRASALARPCQKPA